MPPTRSEPASAKPGAASTVRRRSWRNRIRAVSSAADLGSRTHSVWLLAGSPGSTWAYPGGMSTPNWNRSWFFCAEARYG